MNKNLSDRSIYIGQLSDLDCDFFDPLPNVGEVELDYLGQNSRGMEVAGREGGRMKIG